MKRAERIENLALPLIKGGLYIIMFLPIFIMHSSLFPFIVPRTVLFRIIVEICLALYLLLAFTHPQYRPKPVPLLKLLGLFVGIMILTSLVGVNWERSFWSTFDRSEGIITWLHLLGYAVLLLGTLRTRRDWHTLLKVAIIAASFQILYSLGEHFGARFAIDMAGGRVAGGIGNASFLATYLIFVIFLAAYLFLYEVKLKFRIWYAVIVGASMFLLLQTQTRGALIGLLAGAFMLLCAMIGKRFARRAWIIIPAAVIVFTALGGALWLNRDHPVIQSTPMLARLAAVNPADITTQNRLIVWTSGLQAMRERVVFGWGWENFNAAFNKHYNPLIARDIGSNPWYDRAHNVLVEVGVGSGILGLAAYVTLMIWALHAVWPKAKHESEQTGSFVLASLLIAYLIQNLFVFDTINSLIFFALLLCFIQYLNLHAAPKAHTSARLARGSPLAMTLTVIALIPALAFAIYYFNIRPALASYYTLKAVSTDKSNIPKALQDFEIAMKKTSSANEETRFALIQYARQKVQQDGITDETRALVTRALEVAEQSVLDNPLTVQMRILLAELYLAADAFDENYLDRAEAHAREAAERAPLRHQPWTLLGRLRMHRGDAEQGIQYLKRATELNTEFPEAYWNVAVAYVLTGNPALADKYLELARAKNFNIYAETNVEKLLKAYADTGNLDGAILYMQNIAERFPENKNFSNALTQLEALRNQGEESSGNN